MKGTLHKSMNYGWMVQYGVDSFYQLYPYDKFTNSIERVEGKEVDFTLVHSWSSQEEKLIEVAIISDKIVDVPKSKAKEMEKQNIIDASNGYPTKELLGVTKGEYYYTSTYGSKGSDEHHEDNLDEIPISSQTEISDEEIKKLAETEYPIFDGDLLGIAHNQEHRRFGFISGYNKAKATSSRTEISDDEIEKEAEKRSNSFNGFTTYEKSAWVMACKWYREQLKQKL